ncbi:MAG: HGGxSTG domain-containing protein [Gammaproteobacteria bacterium]
MVLRGYYNIPRRMRGTCGAKTRIGTSCKAPPVWDKRRDKARNGRCKLHGGKSTGPRTEAGREAIRASNRRRKRILTVASDSSKGTPRGTPQQQ